jgi:PIN domain nuclease of toxin-antitoxin system
VRLLLDTSVLLWWLEGRKRIRAATAELIAEPANDVFVSAVTAWEIAIKIGIGKLAAPPEPAAWLPQELARNSFTPLPVSIEHALAVADLRRHHTDPFDRLLIAQAKLNQLAIVTTDEKFAAYGVDVIGC